MDNSKRDEGNWDSIWKGGWYQADIFFRLKGDILQNDMTCIQNGTKEYNKFLFCFHCLSMRKYK